MHGLNGGRGDHLGYRVRRGCGRAVCCSMTGRADAQAPGLGASVELVDPKTFRVCADPRNLPFSDEAGEGFENKLAELFARKLGEPASYTYYPQVIGFVRNTLNALRCDVIMGVAVGDNLVQTTNPYYHTTYALVFKPGSGLDGVKSLEDPRLQGKAYRHRRRHAAGHGAGAAGADGAGRPYALTVDTRIEVAGAGRWPRISRPGGSTPACCGVRSPDIMRSVSRRTWVVPLLKEHGAMEFRIAMGVRRSDQEWKRRLNRLIAESQPEIDKILAEYGVPLLDEQGKPDLAVRTAGSRWRRHLCGHSAAVRADAPPEPAGLSHGRLSLADARDVAVVRRCLSTDAAQALWEKRDAVFIDVLPQPPRPAGLPASTIWRPKPRTTCRAASGCRTPAMEPWRRRCSNTSSTGWSRPAAAIETACWCSTAWRIAGCRGTRRNGRSRSDIPMWPGIRMAPMAGRRITSRWSRAACCHGRGRRSIPGAEIIDSAVSGDRHGGRRPAIHVFADHGRERRGCRPASA